MVICYKKKEYLGGLKCISVYVLYIYLLLLNEKIGLYKRMFICFKKKEYLSFKINL